MQFSVVTDIYRIDDGSSDRAKAWVHASLTVPYVDTSTRPQIQIEKTKQRNEFDLQNARVMHITKLTSNEHSTKCPIKFIEQTVKKIHTHVVVSPMPAHATESLGKTHKLNKIFHKR